MKRAPLLLLLVILVAVCGLAATVSGAFFIQPDAASPPATEPVTSQISIVAAKVALDPLAPNAVGGRVLHDSETVGIFREDTPIPDLVREYEPYERALLELINAEREKAGLKALKLSRNLSAAASKHSADMAVNNYFSHTTLDGVTFAERIRNNNYDFTAAGENLYAGNGPYNTPENAVKSWMNSPAHRANILSPNFTHIGLGYRFNAESTYGGYYTADFARP